MRGLKRRLARLEQRLGVGEAFEFTAAEEAALASDAPAGGPLIQMAILKACRRYGLEALALASYGRSPLCAG